MTLEHFQLPRDDWYDVVSTDEITGQIRGRIYKDRLIENFNAIERKLNEIIALQPYNTKYPDISKIIYNDTTLNSETNKVVNLKSFIDIMGLKNTILSCSFKNKICTGLTYYDENYNLKRLAGVSIENLGVDGAIWVVLDTNTNELSAIKSVTDKTTTQQVIGKYEENKIYSCYEDKPARLDVLETLLNSMTPYTRTNITKQGYTYYVDSQPNNYMFYTLYKPETPITITDYTINYNKNKE